MLTSGSINMSSLMQALSAVPYVFCTGLYGDDYSEGWDQQRISKASTRGDLHPAVHLCMLRCSLQWIIPLLHAIPFAWLLSERTSVACCLLLRMPDSVSVMLHKSSTWLQYDKTCSQQSFCFHSTLTKHSMCSDPHPDPTLAHTTLLSTGSTPCYSLFQKLHRMARSCSV